MYLGLKFQVSLLGCKDFVWSFSQIGKEDPKYCSVCPRKEHLCMKTNINVLPAACAAKWSHCFCISLCILGHDNGFFQVVLGIYCLTLQTRAQQMERSRRPTSKGPSSSELNQTPRVHSRLLLLVNVVLFCTFHADFRVLVLCS